VQSPPRLEPSLSASGSAGRRALLRAGAIAAVLVIGVGVLGTLGMRGWGRVPFSVPSFPWYHAWPYYLFWSPRVDWAWAALALPVAVVAAAAMAAGARLLRSRRAWLAGSLLAAFVLDLAVAAMAGGPVAWPAPLATSGEYPAAVPGLGSIPAFLRHFAERVPSLPDYAAQHPPGATLFYAIVDRVWPGLEGAAVATVAAACLGLLVVASLARDELAEAGERWAVVYWALAPAVVLYAATSADAMWVPVLAGAAVAAHRGLQRRSVAWTLAGGALLWLASMMTFAAVLVLPFLLVRAAGVALGPGGRGEGAWGWVLRWGFLTAATVLALVLALWLTAGYDVVAAVRAVSDFWSTAPGTRTRSWWKWAGGDLVAFAAILGVPLTAALVAGTWTSLRRRAWWSLEAATLASLLAGAMWGHTRGEVERMWQFLVPFAVVVAVRQLLRWRASLPLVATVLLVQTVAIQLLFFTRW
jgi:methylthioxylose transferase